jgi:DHA3 family macrolide efflux protein-like MFS transporter
MVHGDLDPSARRWPDPGGLDGLGTNAVGTVHLSGSIPLVNTPAWSLIPLLVRGYFGGGPAQWGWFIVARNAGSVIGGMLMGTWGGFRRRIATMLGGLVLLGLVNVVRGLVPPNAYWLFLVAALVSGPPAAMFFATLKAVLQSTIPLEM